MRFFAAALIFFGVAASYAQTPEVPHKMSFAGMTLTIRDDARREIQADVDALTRSAKHFAIKLERAKTYFPIIKRIFEQEGLPEDFKYLVMQESALIPDAVSVSNAVGFWQFKDFTAVEMGLRVDKEVDERMNIVSSTRAAARYLKKSNAMFDNWIYALQSYQMGAGGVRRSVSEKHFGARHMEITSATYWYVKKFLAHKVAFENAVEGRPQVVVNEIAVSESTSIKELAKKFLVEESELTAYNKWALRGSVPGDRKYVVLIPNAVLPETAVTSSTVAQVSHPKQQTSDVVSSKKSINGVVAIQALPGERLAQLAERGKVDVADFVAFNDVSIDHMPVPGLYYFLSQKKTRGSQAFHHLKTGENLWMVSQQFGVQLKKLRRYNRVRKSEELPQGAQVWLSARKPRQIKTTRGEPVLEVDASNSIVWAVTPPSTPVAVEAMSETPLIITPDSTKTEKKTSELTTPSFNNRETSTAVNVVRNDIHIVQPGETLYNIAKQRNVTVMQLVDWNKLQLNEPLSVGQTLRLSNSNIDEVASEQSLPVQVTEFHEVQGSDTLYSVAKRYGITIKELMEWNGKTDFSIHVGERLRVVRR